MIAIPAVDLREGRCVQLVGGRPEEERVSHPDPLGVARKWWEQGFSALHIVDLDAALGLGSNRSLIVELVENTEATVQVGGGIRTTEDLTRLLGAGAHRVIVGTRAIDDREWLERSAARYPGRIVVAADIREGRVLRKGWTESSDILIGDLMAALAELPLAGLLCTDVSREGRMEGIDLEGITRILEESPHPVWASGGITTMKELRALDEGGAEGAVLGMALYTGALPLTQVTREFGR